MRNSRAMNDLDVDLRQVMIEATNRHSRTPSVSFDIYREARYKDLDRLAAARRSVYLDINYWWSILRPNHPRSLKGSAKLREILRSGVGSGRFFCPVSWAVFVELMKYRDEQGRIALANLMDELSIGIGIRNPFDIAQIEYLKFFAHFVPRLSGYIDRVWAPIGHIVHEVYPYQDEWPHEIMEQGRKVMCDVHWAKKMRHLAKRTLPEFQRTAAQKINDARQVHHRGNRTFDQLFVDELGGVLEDVVPHIDQILSQMEHARFKPEEIEVIKRQRTAAVERFRQAAVEPRDNAVPSRRISAALHAAKRLDDDNPFKENDLDDFRHASIALGYCDFFLCDRSLAVVLANPNVRKVIPLGCTAISDCEAAINILDSKQRGRS
jgi:hypothetical protein